MTKNIIVAASTAVTLGVALVILAPPMTAQESGDAAGSDGMQGDQMPHQMMSPGLMMPVMDPANGRKLFAAKGCVVCHSINGIGGTDAAALDASTMGSMMNPFDFAAKMWEGAEAMIVLQQEELGEQILFSGQELADIIAFVHHVEEQKKFTEADIPPNIKALMKHMEEQDGEGHEHMGDESETGN